MCVCDFAVESLMHWSEHRMAKLSDKHTKEKHALAFQDISCHTTSRLASACVFPICCGCGACGRTCTMSATCACKITGSPTRLLPPPCMPDVRSKFFTFGVQQQQPKNWPKGTGITEPRTVQQQAKPASPRHSPVQRSPRSQKEIVQGAPTHHTVKHWCFTVRWVPSPMIWDGRGSQAKSANSPPKQPQKTWSNNAIKAGPLQMPSKRSPVSYPEIAQAG